MVTDLVAKEQGLSTAERMRTRARQIGSWLCVGLDPSLDRLPDSLPRSPDGVLRFCTEIIHTTAEHAVCFKLNFGFYEALGPDGWRTLYQVRRAIPPEVPVIADAKRGDIGSTAEAYASAIFDKLTFDAVTVNPYLGVASLSPFLSRHHRLVLVVCRTSNRGEASMQDWMVNGAPLYVEVAREMLELDAAAEVGLVVGATQPEALRAVRALSQSAMLLLPGVGAQGADAAEALKLGANEQGDNAMIAASRQIIYASSGRDFASAAATVARQLVESMTCASR